MGIALLVQPMDEFLQLLTEWGYAGMFISAFLAGTVLPFSSETVLLACIGLGLDPVVSTLVTTAGNALGGYHLLFDWAFGKNGMDRKILKGGSEAMESC